MTYRGHDERVQSEGMIGGNNLSGFKILYFELLNQIILFFQIMIKMFQNILIVENF